VLADEINRAPAKVQSALLEAMQERQVTIGDTTHKLPDPFLVMATQNPIEQEGTYALPEAQLDRFMLMIKVGYPTREEERAIMDRMTSPMKLSVDRVATPQEIAEARSVVQEIYIDEKIRDYIVSLVHATVRRRTAGPTWPTSSRSAPARAPGSTSTWWPARTPSCATAATSRPRHQAIGVDARATA
jgi:MoxR-like ATPase